MAPVLSVLLLAACGGSGSTVAISMGAGAGGAGGPADGGVDRPSGAGTGGGGTAGSGGAMGTGGDPGPSCPAGRTLCAAECVDTTANPRYCGGCGKPCGTNQVCSGSACQTPPDCRSTPCVGLSFCDLGTGLCKAGCALDTQCGANETCDAASHACVCKTGDHRCSGVCVSNMAVATCGASCSACPVDPNGVTACDGTSCTLTCSAGYKACGGVCAACPTTGTSASACSGTACVATTCSNGYHLCSGQCSANTSPASCGPSSCTPCPTSANGVATCSASTCGLSCNTGYQPCGGACAACPTANTTASACSGTACVATACSNGYHVCSGACVSSSSLATCGTSCTACPTTANGTPTCNGTMCGTTCATGYKLCGGVCALCPTGTTAFACNGTQCQASSCPAGNHVCSGQCVSTTSVQACGTTCVTCAAAPANGMMACNLGACVSSCNTNYVACGAACCPDCRLQSGACTGVDWCQPTNYCQPSQKLQQDTSLTSTSFGWSVALSGSLAVVGARNDNALNGAVYLLARQSSGLWTMPGPKLLPDPPVGNGYAEFGASTALQGQRLLVGAPTDLGFNGAAYLYDGLSGGVFGPSSQAKWSGEMMSGSFGASVALSGDRVLVGAPNVTVAGISSAGAAYIFERQADGSWPTTGVKIVAADPAANASFGAAVSLSGDWAIVGAPGYVGSQTAAGLGAYFFARQSTGGWVQQQKVSDTLVRSLSMSGNRALVGAPQSSDLAVEAGAVYVYELQSSGTWMRTTELLAPPPNAGPYDNFGMSVSLEGDRALVGTPAENHSPAGTGGLSDVGAAYLFQHLASGSWDAGVEIASGVPDQIAGRFFGSAVSLSWPFVLVAASSDIPAPPAPASRSGTAYVINAQAFVP